MGLWWRSSRTTMELRTFIAVLPRRHHIAAWGWWWVFKQWRWNRTQWRAAWWCWGWIWSWVLSIYKYTSRVIPHQALKYMFWLKSLIMNWLSSNKYIPYVMELHMRLHGMHLRQSTQFLHEILLISYDGMCIQYLDAKSIICGFDHIPLR